MLENLSFIVLCPYRNFGGLCSSKDSIDTHFPHYSSCCVVGNDVSKKEITEFNSLIKTYTAGTTITSLINKGLTESNSDWNFIFMAGSRIYYHLLTKFSYFAKDKTHILYPVVNRKWAFDESSLNGLLIHKETFNDVGPFAEKEENIEIVKLFWAMDALEKGYKFRAIVGASTY